MYNLYIAVFSLISLILSSFIALHFVGMVLSDKPPALKFDPEDDDREEVGIEETDETLFGGGG